MKKFVYFVALSLGLLVFLSCVQALKDSLEVMTMDPAERKAYGSLSDEEKDKYLQMNQEQRDQFRFNHDPAVIPIQKRLDVLKRRLVFANEDLRKVTYKNGEVRYGKTERWNMLRDNITKFNVEIYSLETHLSRLKQEKMKEYAESRAAWEAKNQQMSGPVSGGCFTPDTLVLMESGFKRIADIKAGDRLRTVDPGGNHAVNTVAKHFVFTNNHYYLINGKIKVTSLHRFYTRNGWIRARDLKTGDRIQTSDGSFEEIVSKERFSADLTVYNLNIADNHNFFVSSDGKKGYLVHNTGGGGGK